MYARQNNIKINYPIEIDGIRIHSAQWLAGQSQQWRDANSITIHDDPVSPPYDSATEKLVMGEDGDWQVVALSSEEIRRKAKAALNDKLNSMSYTYADGRVIQARPQDLTNFQLTIAKGQDEEWVMADNTLSIMTVAELNEAMSWAINQAGLYWDEYKDVIRNLP